MTLADTLPPTAPHRPANADLRARIDEWLATEPDYAAARLFSQPTASVLADSVNAETGDRLTTFAARMPLIIWQELLTHKHLSRNSGSSRAVPILNRIWSCIQDPFVPDRFPLEGRGMQPPGFTEPGTELHERQVRSHLDLMRVNIRACLDRLDDGMGKEIVNRYLYAWLWNDAVVSGTTWTTVFGLRCHPDAQRQIRLSIEAIRDARDASTPRELARGDWHLPLTGFAGDEDLSTDDLIKVSVGRAARTSYLTHLGTRDPQADLDLYDRVRIPKHLSPFEHVAHAQPGRWANFEGFRQARWYVERELEPSVRNAGLGEDELRTNIAAGPYGAQPSSVR